MMVGVKAEEAERFYEDDEDPREVFAAFDVAQKDRTAPPPNRRGKSSWSAKMRLEIAAFLRRLAKVIEPSHARTR
jgi:hypothetical protein